jgi:hypothetical protein
MILSKKDTSEHCWEFMNCSYDMRVQCIAYKSDSQEPCWILHQARGRDGCAILGTCTRCPWFLKNNPDF